jgi:hypothetical protein
MDKSGNFEQGVCVFRVVSVVNFSDFHFYASILFYRKEALDAPRLFVHNYLLYRAGSKMKPFLKPVGRNGIEGARSGRASGGTPGKPGFCEAKMRAND